ncbi:hypothetical protein J4477_02825 [Candidatus Pacearchaeota archaeon]|nr:hypothetical protein [Candidatus Pacearchaeota archaeon]
MIEYTKVNDGQEIGKLEREEFGVIFTSLKDADVRRKYSVIDARTPRLPSYIQAYHITSAEGEVTLIGEIETSSREAKISITGRENARTIVKKHLEEIAILSVQTLETN